MRVIDVKRVTQNIKEMCIEANHFLSKDMEAALRDAGEKEESPLGKQVLGQLEKNLKIAGEDMIPICQDTGMAVVFMEIGQEVHFEGGALEDAINEGIRQGYAEGFLRKSVVRDPLERENTKDNTPGVIHYSIIPGERVYITVAPKGFGSENMSRIFMLKPADGIEGVKDAVLAAVKDAGPNACPPMVVGVGIGGTFEKCALLAKKALTRPLGERSPTLFVSEPANMEKSSIWNLPPIPYARELASMEKSGIWNLPPIPYVRELEQELLYKINCLGIGPGGLGGRVTALAVHINTYPTHIAGLPLAVNIGCHVNRHSSRML